MGGEVRIKVEFPYNRENAYQLKQIPGAVWSQLIRAWQIPYHREAFEKLKSLFPELDYPKKDDHKKETEYIRNLKELRYSHKTEKIYLIDHNLTSAGFEQQSATKWLNINNRG